MSTPRSAHLALFGVQVCFASWAISGKLALAYLGVRGILAFRIAGATLGFALVARVAERAGRRRGDAPWRWPTAREWPMLALYAGLGVVGNQLLYLQGLRLTPVTSNGDTDRDGA